MISPELLIDAASATYRWPGDTGLMVGELHVHTGSECFGGSLTYGSGQAPVVEWSGPPDPTPTQQAAIDELVFAISVCSGDDQVFTMRWQDFDYVGGYEELLGPRFASVDGDTEIRIRHGHISSVIHHRGSLVTEHNVMSCSHPRGGEGPVLFTQLARTVRDISSGYLHSHQTLSITYADLGTLTAPRVVRAFNHTGDGTDLWEALWIHPSTLSIPDTPPWLA
jgi:hypothetical protein